MYNCGCDDCKGKATLLNLSISDDFKQLLNAGKSAFKRLHEIGNYKPQDLKTEKVYQDLIHQTYDVFNFAITDNDMPNEMRTALQSDAFLFGGLKTHAQLFEASKLLLDENGNLKPFNQLSNEFDKLNLTYNKNYLEAEYEFAVGSSQMASKWAEFSDNDRYYLQYRTAGDNRVRQDHEKLNETTLPKSDPFWGSYTPPNGWNCRCTIIEVLKDKYPLSDSEKSIKAGEAATTQIGKDGKNRLEIFRFNPGAQKVVFPPAHPYGKVLGAKVVESQISKIIKTSKRVENIQEVLKKPIKEQYKTILNHTSGARVDIHLLVNTNAEDYKDVLNAAKAFARTGKTAKLLPEINIKDKEARDIIFKGLKSKSSNPDLLIGNEYVDVKRPSAIKNITGNANSASKQGATALISDIRLDKNLSNEILNERAKDIFKNKNYTSDKLYFYRDGKIVIKNRTGDK